MNNLSCKMDEHTLLVALSGHIDSTNAPALEEELTAAYVKEPIQDAIIDCDLLDYISSAGLRVILRMKKAVPKLKLVNVSSGVYEVFEMTGFTEIIDVSKAYRKISVEGCEVIGQGANGKVYRIDPETIVKVYTNPDSLPEIERERELARTAFILGIPTAIPYDIVRISEDGSYGSVFELLNAESLAQVLAKDPSSLENVAQMSVSLMKLIHSTRAEKVKLPDMKETALDWARFLEPYLSEEIYTKLISLIEAVPNDDHMLHGDYHLKNIMLQDDECLLIDMDTLCHGHPVFELGSMYNAYQGFSELNHENIKHFLGIDYETAGKLWDTILHLYLKGASEEKIESVKDKAMLLGQVRILRRAIRRGALETEEGRREVENSKKHIIEMVEKLDALTF